MFSAYLRGIETIEALRAWAGKSAFSAYLRGIETLLFAPAGSEGKTVFSLPTRD